MKAQRVYNKLFNATDQGAWSEDFNGPHIFPILIGLGFIIMGIISCTTGISNIPYENSSWCMAIFCWVVGGVFAIPALIDTFKN